MYFFIGAKLKTITFILAVFLLLGTTQTFAFDPPEKDPWYYQSQEKGYAFQIPDKAQHFWGSAFLNEMSKKLSLPAEDVASPLLVFSVGLLYEVWQEHNGLGFSERDLVADALGAITSQFSTETLGMWVEYSTRDKIITFNVSKQF